MANVLKMVLVESILSLHALCYSQRRIARELGVDRETVGKYLRQELTGAKPAIAPAGSGWSKPATLPDLPAPISNRKRKLPEPHLSMRQYSSQKCPVRVELAEQIRLCLNCPVCQSSPKKFNSRPVTPTWNVPDQSSSSGIRPNAILFSMGWR